MKTQHLHDMWSAPDNSRLTSKQFSFRLPVHIAAKLAALSDLYPQKNRTQVVADLLTAALDDLEKNLPQTYSAEIIGEDAHYAKMHAEDNGYEYEPSYIAGGPRVDYRDLVNKHYISLEKELGNEAARAIYPELFLTKSELNAK